MTLNDDDTNFKKINYLNLKIKNIKKIISKLTLETQELILTNCFSSELDLVRDMDTLKNFKDRLYNFKNILIYNENYSFYNDFYCYMMNKLECKKELIEKYGVINYLSNTETQLLPTTQTFSYKYLIEIFEKLKILFENYGFLKKEN